MRRVDRALEHIAKKFIQGGFAKLQRMKHKGIIRLFIVVDCRVLPRPIRLFEGKPRTDASRMPLSGERLRERINVPSDQSAKANQSTALCMAWR